MLRCFMCFAGWLRPGFWLNHPGTGGLASSVAASAKDSFSSHFSDWRTTRLTQELRALLERFGKSVDIAQNLPDLFQDITAAETADSRRMPNRAAAN
jgi:hypothetical protein